MIYKNSCFLDKLTKANLKIRVFTEQNILIGECHFFINEFFSNYETQLKEGLYCHKDYTKKDSLWLEGVRIACIELKFKFSHLIYYEQKSAGIITEKGEMTKSPLFLYTENRKMSGKTVELYEQFILLKEISGKFYKEGIPGDHTEDHVRIREELLVCLSKLNILLLSSEKTSSISFLYKDSNQLNKAQIMFLDILEFLLRHYDSTHSVNKECYFNSLKAIFNRGELDFLALKSENPKIVFRYQRILFEQLNRVFDDLENKGLCQDQRSFIEFYLVYAFFRIHEFREKLLGVLGKDKGERGDEDGDQINSILFGWTHLFQNLRKNSLRKANANEKILDLSLSKNWTRKFESGGLIFLFFIKEWFSYIRDYLQVLEIDWIKISGFKILTARFLSHMENCCPSNYSEILIESSLVLCENPKLLSQMFIIAVNKTK